MKTDKRTVACPRCGEQVHPGEVTVFSPQGDGGPEVFKRDRCAECERSTGEVIHKDHNGAVTELNKEKREFRFGGRLA